MHYQHIDVRPVAGALGAEIDGVDLAAPIADDAFEEIRLAFREHLVLFFRGQHLTSAALADFAARFGPLIPPPYSKPRDDHPFVLDLVREADVPAGTRNVGDRWHSDNAPEERPSLGFALYCVECPPFGGDTMFASLYAAYDELSAGMKALCEPLVVMHSRSGVFGTGGGTKPLAKARERDDIEERRKALAREVAHPLIRVHPESGRRSLFITGDYAVRFQDMTAEESRPLLDWLNRHAVRPEHCCRFRWSPGSLALLDNRCTQHYAINDYAGHRRAMMRAEIGGERPRGPSRDPG